MKKAAAILCLSIYLLGVTDAGQLLKLPLLISHFIKHHHENRQTTVVSFLVMHYVEAQPYDSDYNQDMQLPFKTPTYVFCVNVPSILPVIPKLVFKVPSITSTQHKILNDEVPAHLLTHNIFQPPKA